LPTAARTVHIVPNLKSHSLLSIGQLHDSGCVVEFAATTVTVRHNDVVALRGHRTPATQLWHLELPTTPLGEANAAIGSAKPDELVARAHSSLFSPALSALATALDNNFVANFPGLSSRTFCKHPPHSAATIKGHLDQSRKTRVAKTNAPPSRQQFHLMSNPTRHWTKKTVSLAHRPVGNDLISAVHPLLNQLGKSTWIKQENLLLPPAPATIACSFSTTATAMLC
jgi:hypothetical protein